MPVVIAVTGTDRQGALNSTSNHGPEIAIAAPSTDIWTTSPNAGYTSRSGTSFAAPMVTGAIAALMSINPSLPGSTLLSLLRSTATPITGQTFGQLQAARTAVGLLPGIIPHAGPWTTQRSLEADFYLPPSDAPIDIYVAATTPAGEFSLLPDCTWASAAASGYTPAAKGYRAAGAASGVLFGPGGACASIPLAGLTPGRYALRVAATIGGNLLGAVNGEAFDIMP